MKAKSGYEDDMNGIEKKKLEIIDLVEENGNLKSYEE